MAWTTPRDWTTGELVTEAMMDTHVKDNLVYLKQRELWVPVTYGDNGLGPQGDHVMADCLNAGDQAYVTWKCPFDFVTLSEAYLVVRPLFTQAAANWNIGSQYGAIGESYITHNENDGATTYNVTQDILFGVDCSGILTNLAAGDIVGISINLGDNAHDFALIGFYMKYT